ncbi:MAG: hypothetical protein WCP97_04035 [bacterium]
MLFNFGIKTKTLGTKDMLEYQCPSCKQFGLRSTIKQSYFHILFIPTFPLPKTAFVECLNCHQPLNEDALPDHDRAKVKKDKKAIRAPLYFFSGLLVGTLFLIVSTLYGNYVTNQDSKNTTAFLQQPMQNDLYVFLVEEEGYPYALYQLLNRDGEELLLQAGNVSYKTLSDAKQAISTGKTAAPDYYYKEKVFVFTAAEIKDKLASGTLLTVIRPSNPVPLQPAFQEGGLYSIENKNGTFAIAKLLVLNDKAAHIRIYKNRFDTRPTIVDPATLELGTTAGSKDYGIGHLPFTRVSFFISDPHFIMQTKVTDEELDGYREWEKAKGGLFGEDEQKKTSDGQAEGAL